jgi:hypothetical protein
MIEISGGAQLFGHLLESRELVVGFEADVVVTSFVQQRGDDGRLILEVGLGGGWLGLRLGGGRKFFRVVLYIVTFGQRMLELPTIFPAMRTMFTIIDGARAD